MHKTKENKYCASITSPVWHDFLTDEAAAPVHHRVTGHAGLWLLQQVRLQPSASHRTGDRQVRAEVHRRVGVLLQRERANHVPQLRAREHPRQMPPKTSRLHWMGWGVRLQTNARVPIYRRFPAMLLIVPIKHHIFVSRDPASLGQPTFRQSYSELGRSPIKDIERVPKFSRSLVPKPCTYDLLITVY